MNDGGPAFPGQQPTGFDPRSGNFNEGMTLRDYFAAHAPSNCMVFLRDWKFSEPEPQPPEGYGYFKRGGSADRERLAEEAGRFEALQNAWCDRRDRAMQAVARYAYADAMLAARESK